MSDVFINNSVLSVYKTVARSKPPSFYHKSEYCSQKDRYCLEAIYEHAENSSNSLIIGFQSIGALLAGAADNRDMGINISDIARAGELIKVLGDLLEACLILKNGSKEALNKEELSSDSRGGHVNGT